MAATGSIRLAIDSELRDVWLVGVAVQAICLGAGMDQFEAESVQLAVVEAVNNVIIHAYNSLPAQPVEIEVTIHPDRLVFQIKDSGEPMPPDSASRQAHDMSPEIIDIYSLQEGGRGLLIIQNVMDETSRETIQGKNILTMTKRLTVS